MILTFNGIVGRLSNKFYQHGALRAAKVQELFATLSGRYDLINDVQSLGLHRLWKRTLVRMAAPKPGESALDVCCGTGDIALGLHRQGAQVTGLDFCPPMLAIAQHRAARLSPSLRRPPPRFVQGDAMELPFEENSFDIVTVGYGLRNLASWERGLQEMWRVSRQGGRLLVLDFGKPRNPIWRSIYSAYLQFFVPILGKVLCRDAAALGYIHASMQEYPAQSGIHHKLQALGCRRIAVRNIAGGAMSIHYALKS